MDKKTKLIVGVAAFVVVLLLISVLYNQLIKKVEPQQNPAPTSSQTQKVKAPDFTVQDMDGNTVSFSDFKGKPVVINFWASWCPPCKAEMPDYEEMFKTYSTQGVVFLMVNMTDGERETTDIAKQFLKDNDYTFTTYFDVEQSAAVAYGISSIPDSIFIDKEGNVVRAYKGLLDRETMEENILAIMK